MKLLLQMSLTGGLLIAAVLLIRLLLQHRIHRSVLLLLWGVVLLRLLVPVFVQADWYSPIFPAESAVRTASPVSRQEAVPAQAFSREAAVPAQPITHKSTSVYVPPAVQDTQFPLSKTQCFFAVWLCGAVGLFLFFTISHFRNRRSYRFSVPVPAGVELPEGLRVRMLDGLNSPLTYGLFRPTVLLPVSFPWEDAQRLRHVLLHEQTHIRRHDLVTKLVYLLALCVHWFNPLVWMMQFFASEDMEMRCDALVIRQLGKKSSRAYADTLLAAERAKLTSILQAGFSYSSTATRLKAIVRGRTYAVLSGAVAVALTLVFALGFFTGRTAAAPVPQPAAAELVSVVIAPSAVQAEVAEKGLAPAELSLKLVLPQTTAPVSEVPHPMADEQDTPEAFQMNEDSTCYLTIWSTGPVTFSLKNAEAVGGSIVETYLMEQTEHEQRWYCSIYAGAAGQMTLAYESDLRSGEIAVEVLQVRAEYQWQSYTHAYPGQYAADLTDWGFGIPSTTASPFPVIPLFYDPTPTIPWPSYPGTGWEFYN